MAPDPHAMCMQALEASLAEAERAKRDATSQLQLKGTASVTESLLPLQLDAHTPWRGNERCQLLS